MIVYVLNAGIGEIRFVNRIYKTVVCNVYNLRYTKRKNKNKRAVNNFITSTFRKKFTQRAAQFYFSAQTNSCRVEIFTNNNKRIL